MADREWSLPAFGARVQEHARRLGLAGFWQWWKGQLDALMPSVPRAALARRRMRPVLVFGGDSATLWRSATDNGRPVMAVATTIPLTGDAATIAAAGRAALAPLTRMAYGGQAAPVRAVISLPARDVLRRNIVLPSAVEENFRQALAYDLDRHTPFKPEELYFDATIVARDAVHNTITIDLAAARRAIVDPALKHAAAWGANVAAVVPEPPERAAGSRLNLLPADARTSSSAWTRWQFWVPISVLAAAAVAAVVIPLWQKREYVMQLNPLAEQARRRAAVSETLRAELDARVADYNTALERKYAYPSALQVVDAVSKLLPDDTWLTQFELKSMSKGKEIQRDLLVRGETGNSGRLVQLFEESQLFAQAAPRSPMTKIQPGPGEIFDLGAQLKTRALPAPIALAVADTPAEAPPRPSSAPPAGGPVTGTPPPTGAPPPLPAPAAGTAPSATPPPSSTVPATGTAPPATPPPSSTVPAAGTAPPVTPPPPTAVPAAGTAPPVTPPPSSAAPAPAAAAPGAPAPGLRARPADTRPADAGAPPPANPSSPALAPPAEAGNNGGGRRP
jgi:general secretion pathway protein L